jgi:hypothetical protein
LQKFFANFQYLVRFYRCVGSGAFKTAYNLKGQPDLLVVLLKSGYQATEIKKEIGYLKQLEALGIKTLLSIFNRESPSGTQLLSDNFTSCAPLIFCITIPCRLTLDLGIDVSINVIFL